MTSAVYAGVRDILAAPDWEPVTVTDHGQFFTISGYFRSMAHTGSRKDWESLARDLDRIAREQFDALMGRAEPAAEVAPEPEPELVAEPPPPPEPDPRDAELEAMRAKIAELEARELELKDANACLKDALSDIEDRIADLDAEDQIPDQFDEDDAHKFPAPHERLTDWDVVGDVPAWLVGDQYAREGEDMDDRIRRLTNEFKARVNVLNNFLLDASITPEQEAELADKQAKYHELAELGDRS